MNQRKIIGDYIIGTRDTIYLLNKWLMLLEQSRQGLPVESSAFEHIEDRLRQARLGEWLNEIAGHDLDTLIQAVEQASTRLQHQQGRRI